MPGIARTGIDSAGGTQYGKSPNVFINNAEAVRVGDPVAGHGLSPHGSPVMSAGSETVFVNQISVCREGDSASCGHASTGSNNVFAG